MFVAPGSSQAAPAFGPNARSATVNVSIPASGDICNVNLQGMPPGQALPTIATIYTDGSCPVDLVFRFSDTTQRLTVPAYTQGYFPALTSSLQFQVSSPELPGLGQPVSVPIQVFSVPVQQTNTLQTYPNGNSGLVADIGSSGGWNTFTFSAPGAGLIFKSLELNNGPYSEPVTISGTDIYGNPWSRSFSPFTDEELQIPPTAAGSSVTAATATPTLAGGTTAILVSIWRVALAGIAPSTTLPSTFTSFTASQTDPGTSWTANLPLPAGFGAYIASVTVGANALPAATGSSYELVDNSGVVPPATGFWLNAFTGQTYTQGPFTVGWTSKFRGGNIEISVTNTVASGSGTQQVQIVWAPVAASQNG